MKGTRDLSPRLTLILSLLGLALSLILFDGLCPIRRAFGIPCPGCGMTRAVLALLQGDPMQATRFHPMVWALPLIGFMAARNTAPTLFPRLTASRRYRRAESGLALGLTCLTLLIYIIRVAGMCVSAHSL